MAEMKRRRMTRQKQEIYDILCSTDCHPTAEWIYQEVKKRIPAIGLGTVYRNLGAMMEEGIIAELHCGKGPCRYDGVAAPHFHFVCECCGRVLDFPAETPQVDLSVLAMAPGLVQAYRLECRGICSDCQQAGAEKNALEA